MNPAVVITLPTTGDSAQTVVITIGETNDGGAERHEETAH
jgi:hypothetical protein